VLYEGYILYPYRASSAKNRYRWQFGVVAPRDWSDAGGDPWEMQTECLVVPGAEPKLEIAVRFLQVQPGDNDAWDEGVERVVEVPSAPLDGRLDVPIEIPVSAIAGWVRLEATRHDAFVKLRIRIENLTPFSAAATAARADAMRLSMTGVHTMMSISDGAFVSMIDPPLAAAALAAGCVNLHTWPVLVGPEGSSDVMLSSPIILQDYPAIAPESPGDFFDATEMDEMLTLRVMTMTDQEKQEARATDPRARAIIERCDTIPPEIFERLHGAIRSLKSSEPETFFNPPGYEPERQSVEVGAERVSRGGRVRLAPRRNADAQDLFLAGRIARVEAVHRDVEDRVYVAVTVEDDPAADIHRSFGRFFYFYPEELEPVTKEN
jgi:hypothetical protein